MHDRLSDLHPTRAKLVLAAAPVFADKGYRDAKVRDICRRAGVNAASVNYHFGSKMQLYAEVLRHAYDTAGPHWPMPLLADDRDRPELLLRRWTRWFVERMLGEHLLSRFIFAELRDPTPALDELVERSMQPVFQEVAGMIAAVAGLPPDDPRVGRCVASLFGQCTFYRMARPLLERLPHGPGLDSPSIETVTDHVFEFSMAGIRAITAEENESSAGSATNGRSDE
jgi:AcrR family transcriptional regulator